jgi:DNA-binding transcriptional MerR regulator
LEYRYTRSEVERMVGVSRRQLEYWTRLQLVFPRARWGERFFSFSDLVALETIKRLAARQVPARRIRRAVAPLSTLRISTNGKQVVVQSPFTPGRVLEPLTGQFVLDFETSDLGRRVHALPPRSAEEWFELGMECDSQAKSLQQSAQAYRQAVEAAPDWVEARINLGTTLFQLDRIEEAREQFESAISSEPDNALAEFNLGCVLDHLGHTNEAIRHLLRAAQIAPSLAEAHLNLALAYEKRGQFQDSIRHLTLYLRYDPNGAWAEFARARLAHLRSPRRPPSGKLTPFRRIR